MDSLKGKRGNQSGGAGSCRFHRQNSAFSKRSVLDKRILNNEPLDVPKDWIEKWKKYGPIKLSWVAMNARFPIDISDETHEIVY